MVRSPSSPVSPIARSSSYRKSNNSPPAPGSPTPGSGSRRSSFAQGSEGQSVFSRNGNIFEPSVEEQLKGAKIRMDPEEFLRELRELDPHHRNPLPRDITWAWEQLEATPGSCTAWPNILKAFPNKYRIYLGQAKSIVEVRIHIQMGLSVFTNACILVRISSSLQ
jgi:hypothetical protein